MKLLSRLTKFYKEEENNIPHSHADLFEIAWDLAEKLEWWGPDSNAWKESDEEFDEMLNELRAKHTVAEYVTLIDTTVNEMHQTLVENGDEEILLGYSQGDIAEYLLRREDPDYYAEYRGWRREEIEEAY